MAEIPDMLSTNAGGSSNALPVGRFRTLREVNERNREFWLEQAEVTEKWMSDEAVFSSAMIDLQVQDLLGTPLRLQKSFEKALADADERIHGRQRLLRQFRTALAKKGGSATKTDALQQLILGIVRKNRNMTVPQLLAWLGTPLVRASHSLAPQDRGPTTARSTSALGRENHERTGGTFMIRIDSPASPGLGKAYRSVSSRWASPLGNPQVGTRNDGAT